MDDAGADEGAIEDSVAELAGAEDAGVDEDADDSVPELAGEEDAGVGEDADDSAPELAGADEAGADEGAAEDSATELGASEDTGVDDAELDEAGVELLPPPPQAVSPRAIIDKQKARGTYFMVMVSLLWFIVVVNYTIRQWACIPVKL